MALLAWAADLFGDEVTAIEEARRRLGARKLLSLLPGVLLIGLGVLSLQATIRRERLASQLEQHEREHREPLEAISP